MRKKKKKDPEVEFTKTAKTLRDSDSWIPYKEGSYENLTLEERRYYLNLVKLAYCQTTQSYYEDREDSINSQICNFFSDFCQHLQEKKWEVKDRFGIIVPELQTEIWINEIFFSKLCYVEYLNTDKWRFNMEYDQTADSIYQEGLTELIDETFITKSIISKLEKEIAAGNESLNYEEVAVYLCNL